MAKGKYGKRCSGLKPLTLLLTLVLLVGGSIGGTLAWLSAETEAVENTFTVGDIGIELTETKEEYKMVPGHTIHKDPLVTVEAGSEDCWVFVKVEESDNFDTYMTYQIADGWTKLDGIGNDKTAVYYRQQEFSTTDVEYKVLKDDQVKVRDTVTKQMMDGLKTGSKAELPTLTFTAYAVQYNQTNDKPFEVADAWAKVNP